MFRQREVPSLPVPVCKFVPRDSKKPGSDIFDRFGDTVTGHQLVEDVLQNIFCVALVPYPSLDEIEEPIPLCFDGDIK